MTELRYDQLAVDSGGGHPCPHWSYSWTPVQHAFLPHLRQADKLQFNAVPLAVHPQHFTWYHTGAV